jgi:ribosome biogenesis GTPase A
LELVDIRAPHQNRVALPPTKHTHILVLTKCDLVTPSVA